MQWQRKVVTDRDLGAPISSKKRGGGLLTTKLFDLVDGRFQVTHASDPFFRVENLRVPLDEMLPF